MSCKKYYELFRPYEERLILDENVTFTFNTTTLTKIPLRINDM